jgi:transposase InsO family protein
LDGAFCLAALNQALAFAKPTIFNTDQGAQFTANAFTTSLQEARVRISMDGRGRVVDNILIERLWRTVSTRTSSCGSTPPCRPWPTGCRATAASTTPSDRTRALVVEHHLRRILTVKEHYGNLLSTLFWPIIGTANGGNLNNAH